jgi:hypothetical protein
MNGYALATAKNFGRVASGVTAFALMWGCGSGGSDSTPAPDSTIRVESPTGQIPPDVAAPDPTTFVSTEVGAYAGGAEIGANGVGNTGVSAPPA